MRPGQEEARKARLERVEAAVAAFAADAPKEKGTEPQRPGADQQRQQERSRITASEGDGAGDEREVGEASR